MSLVVSAYGIRKGQSRRATLTPCCLMDVCRGAGGGLVFAAEADEPDAPADEIRVGIDAEVIVSRAAGQAAGECGAIDNLVGRGDDAVGRCEFEWAVCATTAGLRGCWVGWEVLAGPGRVIDAFPAAGGCWVVGWDG